MRSIGKHITLLLGLYGTISGCQSTAPPFLPLQIKTTEDTKENVRLERDAKRGVYLVTHGYEVNVRNALGFTPGLMIDEIREEGDDIVLISHKFEKSEVRVPKKKTVDSINTALDSLKGPDEDFSASVTFVVKKNGLAIHLLPILDQGTKSINFHGHKIPTPQNQFATTESPKR